ncbi:Fic/DOC family protein [Roseateles sp. YR242]|uniref:Fic family protein n=1 Tax=Roseateles sp. YR242 TaxID=1855305 RepID=UPI0008CD11A8|nr:Fic family protein [Roseateles sp. YR242]SEK60678.1 Fic/DOC family protein [Roseateles sp. YR242]
MATRDLGYEFLASTLKTAVFPPERTARIASVSRISHQPDAILVPSSVAPASDEPLDHLFFALKHEGLNLAAAIASLRRIPGADVANAFAAAPSSRFARTACYLWEIANGEELKDLPAATGAYEKLFDEDDYLTDAVQRNTRWRIDFNGIGSPQYCITVRRTPEVQALLAQDLLAQTAEFLGSVDKGILDRAVRWAYLSETDNSYAIERERPTPGKAEAFAAMLAKAHDGQLVTEEYLVTLQNLAVSNPIDKAVNFREAQNRLRNELRGALGVTYLPPPPELLDEVMAAVMRLANHRDSALDPLVRGSLVSFAFVFAHPFMDGNGRLSRFLFHKVACTDHRLKSGLVLPVSIAMRRHEQDYLAALQSFSKRSRALWDVQWVGDEEIYQDFRGDPEIYRYWDATACVEFGLRMASEALQRDLREEMIFLRRYDAIYRAVNSAVDMNNNDLVLTARAIAETGRLSNNRRKQLVAKGHTEALLDAAAMAAAEAMELLGDEPAQPAAPPLAS